MGMTDMGVSAEALQEQLKVVFAHEAAGSLARVESLLDQPAAPDGRELVEALFREFHTMKVGAAAAGYSHAARALHDAESLLDAVRGSGVGLRAPDELTALRRLVERVRGEFSDSAPVGSEDGLTLRALWPLLTRATATAAAAEGKLVALDLGGGSVLLEGAAGSVLRGALLHLVRNAVAHGIEPPAERQAAGKPRVGRVLVAALREPAALVRRGLPTTAAVSIAPRSPPPPAAPACRAAPRRSFYSPACRRAPRPTPSPAAASASMPSPAPSARSAGRSRSSRATARAAPCSSRSPPRIAAPRARRPPARANAAADADSEPKDTKNPRDHEEHK